MTRPHPGLKLTTPSLADAGPLTRAQELAIDKAARAIREAGALLVTKAWSTTPGGVVDYTPRRGWPRWP